MKTWTRLSHYLVLVLVLSEVSQGMAMGAKAKLVLDKLKATLPHLIKRLPPAVRHFLAKAIKFFAWILAFVGMEKGVQSVYEWLFAEDDGKVEVRLPGGPVMKFDPRDMPELNGDAKAVADEMEEAIKHDPLIKKDVPPFAFDGVITIYELLVSLFMGTGSVAGGILLAWKKWEKRQRARATHAIRIAYKRGQQEGGSTDEHADRVVIGMANEL